jgi:hypothetical protein
MLRHQFRVVTLQGFDCGLDFLFSLGTTVGCALEGRLNETPQQQK